MIRIVLPATVDPAATDRRIDERRNAAGPVVVDEAGVERIGLAKPTGTLRLRAIARRASGSLPLLRPNPDPDPCTAIRVAGTYPTLSTDDRKACP